MIFKNHYLIVASCTEWLAISALLTLYLCATVGSLHWWGTSMCEIVCILNWNKLNGLTNTEDCDGLGISSILICFWKQSLEGELSDENLLLSFQLVTTFIVFLKQAGSNYYSVCANMQLQKTFKKCYVLINHFTTRVLNHMTSHEYHITIYYSLLFA